MAAYYRLGAKKNKKLRPEAEKFSKDVDIGVMLLLVIEYMQNVCRRWQLLKLMINREAAKVLTKMQRDF
jgi:hypothetical protein